MEDSDYDSDYFELRQPDQISTSSKKKPMGNFTNAKLNNNVATKVNHRMEANNYEPRTNKSQSKSSLNSTFNGKEPHVSTILTADGKKTVLIN